MEYRRLGKSGLQLSALSFGSWVSFNKQIDDRQAEIIMSHAYDNGINFFDNAEVYAQGESERMMGRILKKKKWDRTSYVVSSKAYFGWHGKDNKPNQTGNSRKHLTEACNEALQRFQLDYLDLFYCHRADKNTPIEETVWAMNHLIQQGKILYWGTSEWSAQQITEAHYVAERYKLIAPVMEQPQYNMLERKKMEGDYLPLFNNFGLGTTIWSPLASGVLTGKYLNGIPEGSRMTIESLAWIKEKLWTDSNIQKVTQLKKLADELGVSLTKLSIAWCLKNPHVSTVILGATSVNQLKENLGSLEAVHLLNDGVMARIEGVLQNKPVIPSY